MTSLRREASAQGAMFRMVGAEVLKVRTRWMPYILLIVMIAVLGLNMGGPYAGWALDEEQDPQEKVQVLQTFARPWSFVPIFSTLQSFGAILLPILAAVMVGSEYGWGTVRQVLIRGQTRAQYLTAKLAAICLVGIIGFVLALAFGLLFSTIVTIIADRAVGYELPSANLSVPDVLLMGLRSGYGILVYVVLAFAIAEVWRSSIGGIASVFVYSIVEAIVIGILTGIGGRAADFRDLFIGHNVNALLAENRIGDAHYFSITPLRPIQSFEELPDPLQAALVLAAYSLFFVAIAFWVFQRRDIHA